LTVHSKQAEIDWTVTLVDTGLSAMTGARIKKIEKFITGDTFFMTYGDGVTDLNIIDALQFHHEHAKIGTVTGVSPPSRYGELTIHRDQVVSFNEKPVSNNDSINGGYFIFNREIFDYLTDDDDCILERDPLENLAKNGELKVYRHDGFWQCMDTYRDLRYLQELWETPDTPWKTWD